MLAVGIWSAQQGGRRLWALPAAFVLTMALGGVLGIAGVGSHWVESGIPLSIAMLGLLVTLAAKLPTVAGVAACTAAALVHGLAHGSKLPYDGSAIGYIAGFMVSTTMLHLSGIGLARLCRQQGWIGRTFGAATTLIGTYLLLAS